MKRWLRIVLIIAFAAVFLASGFFLGRYFIDSRKQKNTYDALAQIMEQAKPAPTEDKTPHVPGPATDPEDPDAVTEPQPDDNQLVTVHDPVTDQPLQVLPELAELYLMNPDLAGWIAIEGTNINYPVMHTPDRPDYYLYRDFFRKDSVHGCIYMREACASSISDNLVIYGHRMKDGSMFFGLTEYINEAYFRENRYIYFDTLREYHTYEILSVFITTASTGQGFRYHAFENAQTPGEFADFVDTCKELALYETGVSAEYGDKLITLSTCDYSVTNGRLVVVAKRID